MDSVSAGLAGAAGLNPRGPLHQRVARALHAAGAHRLHEIERPLVHAGDDVHPPFGRVHLRLGLDRGVPVAEVAVVTLDGQPQRLFAAGHVGGAHREPGRRDGLLLAPGRRAGDGEGRDLRQGPLDEPNRQRRRVAGELDAPRRWLSPRGSHEPRRRTPASPAAAPGSSTQRRPERPGVTSSSNSFSLSTVLPENARWRSVVIGPGSTCTEAVS